MTTDREQRFGTPFNWSQMVNVPSAPYICGYCENNVASAVGYHTTADPRVSGAEALMRYARICPRCHGLTIFANGNTMPVPLPSKRVDNLPPLVSTIYGEARAALSAGASTGATLLCRTLLMHVACEHGAKPGLSFVEYVDHLESEHLVPPTGKTWLNHIRKQGNLATHQLVAIPDKDARELLVFVEMLLQLAFDFPARVPT
jgi:Domain of unknown function (DUF4145)